MRYSQPTCTCTFVTSKMTNDHLAIKVIKKLNDVNKTMRHKPRGTDTKTKRATFKKKEEEEEFY